MVKWAITTHNHLKMMALAKDTVWNTSSLATILLARTGRILWAKLLVKLPVKSLLSILHSTGSL